MNSYIKIVDNVNFIKFSPELNMNFRKPEAALLIAQLEYWFSKYQNGFYKFMEPCEHSHYKVGDSWVEELSFSRKVLNRAFDLIGIRYKSKSAFDLAVDKFQGKLYASYYDRSDNKTYYIRNHDFIKQFLSSNLEEENHGKSNQSKVIHNRPLRNGQNGRSRIYKDNTKIINTNTPPISPSTHGQNDVLDQDRIGCVEFKLDEKKKETSENVVSLRSSKIDLETQKNSTQQKNNRSDNANAKPENNRETISGNTTGQGIDQSRDTTAQKMVEIWNRYSETKVSSNPWFWLKRRLNKTFAEKFHSDIQLWKNFCSVISDNPFLSGKTSSIGWKADLEWCLRPAHLEKIFSGAYGIDKEKLIAQDNKITSTALKMQIHQSNESESIKQTRIGLLRHFGAPTYVSWFKDTPFEIDEQGQILFQTESEFKRAYIERLMQNVSWANAA